MMKMLRVGELNTRCMHTEEYLRLHIIDSLNAFDGKIVDAVRAAFHEYVEAFGTERELEIFS